MIFSLPVGWGHITLYLQKVNSLSHLDRVMGDSDIWLSIISPCFSVRTKQIAFSIWMDSIHIGSNHCLLELQYWAEIQVFCLQPGPYTMVLVLLELQVWNHMAGYGGWNENGPHRLYIFKCWVPSWWNYSGMIRRYGFVGQRVSMGMTFTSKTAIIPISLLLSALWLLI